MADWTPIDGDVPPEGELLDVITPSGDQRQLIYESGLWFLPDRSMYVYFVPAFWRRLLPAPGGER